MKRLIAVFAVVLLFCASADAQVVRAYKPPVGRPVIRAATAPIRVLRNVRARRTARIQARVAARVGCPFCQQ